MSLDYDLAMNLHSITRAARGACDAGDVSLDDYLDDPKRFVGSVAAGGCIDLDEVDAHCQDLLRELAIRIYSDEVNARDGRPRRNEDAIDQAKEKLTDLLLFNFQLNGEAEDFVEQVAYVIEDRVHALTAKLARNRATNVLEQGR